jgi:hypothetical protein
MSILEEITKALEAIGPDDIARATAELKPVVKDEVIIGECGTEFIQKLWALRLVYHRRQSLSVHTYNFDAQDEEEKQHHLHLACRSDHLSAIVREMAWGEIKDVFGATAWTKESVGLRAGWVLVTCPPETMTDLADQLEREVRVSGVKLGVLQGAVAQLFKGAMLLGAEEEEEEKPKKRKRRVQ